MRRTFALAVLAAVILVAVSVLPGCGCRQEAVQATGGNIDTAKDAAVKAQLLSIKTGIEAIVAATGSLPPDATQATLESFVAPWPENPFDHRPMKPGDGAGDYVYAPGAGTSFTLAVHLSDGSTYAAP